EPPMVLFDSCAPLGRHPCEGAVATCCGCPVRKGGRGCDRGWIDGHNHDTHVAVHQKVHAQNWAAPPKNACTIPLDWDVPERPLPKSEPASDLSGSRRRLKTGRLPARGTVACRARNSALEHSASGHTRKRHGPPFRVSSPLGR